MKRRPLSTCLLALSLLFGGCECSKKSDEEILKERIDTTKVHLYLASKIAIFKADQSPEAKIAKQHLLEALSALRGKKGAPIPPGTAGSAGTPGTGGAAGSAGTPGTGGGAVGSAGSKLTPAGLLALAKALYFLRKDGQELLKSGDEAGMAPVLPLLFTPPAGLSPLLDLNMEHALLLTGMFMLKMDSRSPMPIPPEIMLYEAWMTDPGKLLPGFRGFVRMEKAVIYGTNELCDLAAKEAAGAEAESAKLEHFMEVFRAAGSEADLNLEQVKKLSAGVRVPAHGIAAYCYEQRDEHDKAVEQLDATLKALEESGVAEAETALLRAYVAMQRGEHAKAREYLETARDYEAAEPATKADIEDLLEHLDDDPNIFEEKLGKGFFAVMVTKIMIRQLDDEGVFDELKKTELVTTIDALVTTVSETMDKATDIVPGKGWFDALKHRVLGD